MKLLVRYFVSYAHTNGFGNIEVTLKNEIKSISDISVASEKIEEHLNLEKNSIVIMNFVKLD